MVDKHLRHLIIFPLGRKCTSSWGYISSTKKHKESLADLIDDKKIDMYYSFSTCGREPSSFEALNHPCFEYF